MTIYLRRTAPESAQFTESEDMTIMSKPIGTTVRTGERCPESGIWEVVGTPSTTAPIAKDDRMPPYRDEAVIWRLIQLA